MRTFVTAAGEYVTKRENELKKFYDTIENLKSRSDETPKQISDEEIEELRRKYKTVQDKLQKLKQVNEKSTWEQLKQSLEKSWSDLAKTLKNLGYPL